jgi:hypothetical protein
MDGIPIKLHRPVDWLKAQPPDLTYPSAERHGPCAPGTSFPVAASMDPVEFQFAVTIGPLVK